MPSPTAAERLGAATRKRQAVAEQWARTRNNDVSNLLSTTLLTTFIFTCWCLSQIINNVNNDCMIS